MSDQKTTKYQEQLEDIKNKQLFLRSQIDLLEKKRQELAAKIKALKDKKSK